MTKTEEMVRFIESSPRPKREEIAYRYADLLLRRELVAWGAINQAILRRFTASGLQYIKSRAWRFRGEMV